jgi:mannose-6-phosphate isomerase-like protein (cupin superfamily)
VLQTVDLARLAEDIDSPYRPTPLAKVGGAAVSLFICDDLRSWHRNEAQDTLMLVLEGVLVLDSNAGRAVANEGEVFAVPRKQNHNLSAGMRSSVVLLDAEPAGAKANGHVEPPFAPPGEIERFNVAADVLRGQPFEWLPVGSAGGCRAAASRLWGEGASYTAGEDCLLIVYRGVLDFEVAGETGTVVGSQLLHIPAGTEIRFRSERGATALFVARNGTPLPEAVSSGAPHSGSGRAGA